MSKPYQILPLPEDEAKTAIKLNKEGVSTDQIAIRLSRGKARVLMTLKANGLSSRGVLGGTQKRAKGAPRRKRKGYINTGPITHESYAVYACGLRSSTAHGLGEASAEAHITAMSAGKVIVERGVRRIGGAA